MGKVLKALSALLAYPTAELQAAGAEIAAAVESEPALPPRLRARLGALAAELAARDLYDLQERYVLLFDRTRSLSLHLFEHVHGESRDRGQAMIDLKALYERHGLAIRASELPDYLPLFLEFLSLVPAAEARGLLGETAHIVEAVGKRLEKRGSPYAAVFAALLALADARAASAAPADALPPEADADPADLAALDAAWEDAPVAFGPSAATGCKETLIARIRAARRPAGGAG